jgi:hypothetical protein
MTRLAPQTAVAAAAPPQQQQLVLVLLRKVPQPVLVLPVVEEA